MRINKKWPPVALVSICLLGVYGCGDSASQPTPEQEAQRSSSEKDAMEKFRATNKTGKMKAVK